LQPFFQQNYGFNVGDFPISESFYRNEVSLPIYPDLLKDDVALVVKNILEIISS
jgi:dTDP-4-amino-4,6-dideoxygalactose transaminase